MAPPALRLPSSSGRHSRCTGVTLVELAVIVAVAAVVAAIGVPSWQAHAQKARLVAAGNLFLASLYRARSEAIKRHDRVALCRSADGVFCAAAGGWEQGWIVFHDANNNATREDGEALLQYQQALPPRLRLRGNGSMQSYLSFAPSGAAKVVNGGFQAGTLTLCPTAGGGEARQIIVNAAGRARIRPLPPTLCAS